MWAGCKLPKAPMSRPGSEKTVSEAAKIRVMVIDDHPIVRQGVISVIAAQPDIQVIAEGSSGEEALTLFHRHRPDVTLMDLRLPGISGVEAIRNIRGAFPDSRFIVLTTHDGDEDIYRALEAGAMAYMLKDMFCDEILGTIRAVVRTGRRQIPAAVARRLEERAFRSELSPREMEVLRLVAQGKSNKVVAHALGIGEGTVKWHIVSILSKLEVGDRTAAVTVALQRGIIHL